MRRSPDIKIGAQKRDIFSLLESVGKDWIINPIARPIEQSNFNLAIALDLELTASLPNPNKIRQAIPVNIDIEIEVGIVFVFGKARIQLIGQRAERGATANPAVVSAKGHNIAIAGQA